MRKLIGPLLLVLAVNCNKMCPNGRDIIKQGVSQNDIEIILMMHNKYRLAISEGRVPMQPKGKHLNVLEWDEELADSAHLATAECKYRPVLGPYGKWATVGQNSMEYLTTKEQSVDWKGTISDWYGQYKAYRYPGNNGNAANYQQIVWASTVSIGCSYIQYREGIIVKAIYVCNYGPGGNIKGIPPYLLSL